MANIPKLPLRQTGVGRDEFVPLSVRTDRDAGATAC